jgi:secreted trypsin-like serine protease
MLAIFLQLSFLVTLVVSQECGVVKYTSELIYGGQYAKKGAWPWLVALHDSKTDEFFCGSTLVSPKHVLTGKSSNFKKFL